MIKTKATIHDLAKELNVSPSTVSRALRDNPRISKKTIAAVKDLAAKMNYQHNALASALRVGRSKMIGVIIPLINRNFFAHVLRGIETVANENGYTVLITQSNDDEQSEINNINTLIRAHVDGIIMSVAKTSFSTDHLERVKKAGMPLIIFDRTMDEISASTVVIDDYQVSYRATKHLINQGYKRIAHFTGQQHINIFKDRLRGYMEALQQSGLSIDNSLICESQNLYEEDGRRLMSDLLDRKIEVDAVFSASDFSAVGAVQVCKEKNLRIPEDIGFVGFANEPFTHLISPSLTTIDQKPEEMGILAAQLFFQEITDKEFIARKTVITPELIIRESSLKNR